MDSVRADRGIDGLMVTMPHKRAILDHLDGVSGVAAASGSVNAVKRAEDGLLGAQFDGMGLVSALEGAGVVPERARIWLKGLGGAGLAIAQALLARGVGALFISETDGARVTAAGPLDGAEILPPDGEALGADVLVNATPLGMAPGDPSPFMPEAVRAAAVVADIVADPNRTALGEIVREAGIRLVTGRQMVEHQVPLIGRWLLSAGPEQDDRTGKAGRARGSDG